MSDFSYEIWESTYKGPDEKIPVDMWRRLAQAATLDSDPPETEEQFFNILEDWKFVPGGRILSNLGIEERMATTLYNCFVHSVNDLGIKDPDSIEGIYTMLKAQAHTLKSEGGYGINASWIRPKGNYIKGIGSRTPGVLKFMELWNKSSEIITMGSDEMKDDLKKEEKKKIRKGAQMLVLNAWHPEIKDFIKAKQVEGRFDKFNISVGVVEGFMKSLIENTDWTLEFPDTTYEKYDEWNGDLDIWKSKGYPVIIYETIKASELWDLIMQSTYKRNDPGVLFLDLFNKLNPLAYAEKIFTTNPCGEIGMSLGTCNLGSQNLVKYIVLEDSEVKFDYESYQRDIYWAIRFLDNINDISRVPLPEYGNAVRSKRRIGLGVMGLGSLHLMMGIRYGSPKSLELIEKIYKIKAETEILASAKLGVEKGSFPLFDTEKYFSTYWWKNLNISQDIKDQVEKIGCMRNSHRSMNAPTGNTGILANVVSGGIEPSFMLEYVRWSIVNEHEQRDLKLKGFKYPNPLVGEWFETEYMKFSKRGTDDILKGSFEGIEYEVDRNRGLTKATTVEDFGWKWLKENKSKEEIQNLIDSGELATTDKLTVDDHINVLKIISHYTDMNSSKTVNLPKDYSYEDFKNLYLMAWKNNIKGITTYREGTMTAVLEGVDSKNTEIHSLADNHAPKRPKTLSADIYTIIAQGNKYIVAIGLLNDKPYEIFCGAIGDLDFKFKEKKGKIEKIKRGCYKLIIDGGLSIDNFSDHFAEVEKSLFRLVSTSLRHGVPLRFIVEQLQKSSDELMSLTAAAARVLKKYIQDGEVVSGAVCLDCGSTDLIYTEGCYTCKSCGWSKCG